MVRCSLDSYPNPSENRMNPRTFITLILIGCCIGGCEPRKKSAALVDENIPKITIVAKRMTDAQKLAYDLEMQQQKINLAQR